MHRRARGKILFEVLCASALAASFVGAWDQTGSSALLGSAAVVALFALYWSFGLFARDRVADAVQPAAAVADAREAEVEIAVQEPVFAYEPQARTEPEPEAEVETAAQEQVFAYQPQALTEPEPEALTEAEPVAAAPKKRRARKAQKAAAVVVAEPEPVAIEEPVFAAMPLEQLFDPQPFVRQPRAFGRKARGPRPLSAA